MEREKAQSYPRGSEALLPTITDGVWAKPSFFQSVYSSVNMWQRTSLNCGLSILPSLYSLNCSHIYSCDWNTGRDGMDFQFPLLFQTWILSAAFHKGWWDNQQSAFLFSSLQGLTLKWCSSSSFALLLSTVHRVLLMQMLFPNRQTHKSKHAIVYEKCFPCNYCRVCILSQIKKKKHVC